MRRYYFAFSKIFLLALILIGVGQTRAQVNPQIISYSLESGIYATVTSYGDYAFAATSFGFKIYDISDASNPLEITDVPTPGITKSLCTDGDYLFVADQGNGLLIYDLADIYNPTLLDNLESAQNIRSIYPRGSYLYAAVEEEGLMIVDYSDPNNLELVTTAYLGGEVWGSYAYGNWLYVAQGSAGMGVYNLTDPENPLCSLIWNTTGGNCHDLFIFPTGNYLALADFQNGVYILDLQYPEVPTWYATDTLANYLATNVSGGLYYGVCGWYGQGVQTFDFSGAQLGYLTIGEDCLGAFKIGDYIYVTLGNAGLRVVNCQSPSNLFVETDLPSASGVVSLDVRDNIAYVASLDEGLTVLDVSNLQSPSLVEVIPTGGWGKDALVSDDGNYLYVADFQAGINVFSLADPLHPVWIRTVTTVPGDGCHSLDLHNGVLYVTVYNAGLNVFDLTDPTNPQLTWHSSDTTEYYRELALSENGQYLFAVAEENGLMVYSIYGSDSITYQYTTHCVNHPYDIQIKGNFAYVADLEKGLYVLNIANPAYIFKVDSLPAQDAGAAVTLIDNDHVLLSDWTKGVAVVDVSDPTNISEVGRCETPGNAWKAWSDGQHVILADMFDIAVIDLYSPPGIPPESEEMLPHSPVVLNPACPNPFNSTTMLSFTLQRQVKVKLSVFDLEGRKVLDLREGSFDPGTHSLSFEAKDLASGIYFAHLQADEIAQTQKLLLVK
jgi:hypothetical protein